MNHGPTITALSDLLLTIYDEQKSDWSNETLKGRKPSAKARKLYEYQMWNQVDRKELENWLSEFKHKSDTEDDDSGKSKKKKKKKINKAKPPELNIDFSDKNKFLYLPPLEKDAEFVPILSLRCVLNQKIRSMRIKVMFVRLGENGQKPHGMGFRLENPEIEHQNQENENKENLEKFGRHDFYHAQLLNGFDYGPSVECPDWVPCAQPSFPLLADDPITLLFSLLVTLYGEKYCFQFYNDHRASLPDLSKYIEKLKAQLAQEQ